MAYDSKHRLFLTAATYARGEQPSGVFAYDPEKDSWRQVKSANSVPPSRNWFGWVQLCYDAHHECFIAKVNDRFYGFRYVPAG